MPFDYPLNNMRFLNICGLICNTVAAILMYFYPYLGIQYTETGAAVIQFTGNVSVNGKTRATRHKCLSKLGAVLLAIGFILQLISAIF